MDREPRPNVVVQQIAYSLRQHQSKRRGRRCSCGWEQDLTAFPNEHSFHAAEAMLKNLTDTVWHHHMPVAPPG
jgi:hypothetical protein